MDDCIPGFGINQHLAIYNISAIYYTNQRYGYHYKVTFSKIISKSFRQYYQFFVSGNVSLPRICFRGRNNFSLYMRIRISTCRSSDFFWNIKYVFFGQLF